MWQSPAGNHERCHRLQPHLQCCELRLEIWPRSGCFRAAHVSYLRHCLCSAEIFVFCSIRSFWKAFLKGYSQCTRCSLCSLYSVVRYSLTVFGVVQGVWAGRRGVGTGCGSVIQLATYQFSRLFEPSRHPKSPSTFLYSVIVVAPVRLRKRIVRREYA